MSQIHNEDDIVFPEDLPEQTKRITTPPALKYITSLLYGSGAGLSVLHILLIFVVQPLLEVQYERRNELASFILRKAREVLVLMNKSAKLPPVAIKRGDKYYSDAQVQTEEVNTKKSFVYFEDEVEKERKNKVNDRMVSLRNTLQDYNRYHAQIDELNPLTFQVKKFQGRIDAYSQANLLRIRGQTQNDTTTNQLKKEIRSIKGLFLTGQV